MIFRGRYYTIKVASAIFVRDLLSLFYHYICFEKTETAEALLASCTSWVKIEK